MVPINRLLRQSEILPFVISCFYKERYRHSKSWITFWDWDLPMNLVIDFKTTRLSVPIFTMYDWTWGWWIQSACISLFYDILGRIQIDDENSHFSPKYRLMDCYDCYLDCRIDEVSIDRATLSRSASVMMIS